MSTPSPKAHHAEVMAAIYLAQSFPEVTTRLQYGGWASSATLLADLVSDILRADANTIVECGSGLTTIFAAAMLRRLGRGTVYALEHSETHLDLTRRQLALNGLGDFAEVVHAPLERQQTLGVEVDWYRPDALPVEVRSRADMLVIDGPPQVRGQLSRLGAIQLLRDAPKPVLAYVDDCHTEDTQEILRRWREAGTDFQATQPTPDSDHHLRLEVTRTAQSDATYRFATEPGEMVLTGAVQNGAEAGNKAFLAAFTFFDTDHRPIPGPYPGLHTSRFGPYRYVAGGTDASPAAFAIPLSLPAGVAAIQAKFSRYRHDAPIRLAGPPELTAR